MPFQWRPHTSPTAPRVLEIWPHQSLEPRGFVVMIAVTALLLSVPLIATLATSAFWALLPFPLLAIMALWLALKRSRRDRQIFETLTLSTDLVSLSQTHHALRKDWQDNPYWVELTCTKDGGPVENYLTLKGPAGRRVEIGAFLSPDERVALYRELAPLLPLRGASHA